MSTFSALINSCRKERLGLTMIAGSLLVILLTAALVFHYETLNANQKIRSQGLSLVRLVAEIPFDQLNSPRARNTLKIIYQSQDHKSQDTAALAYVNLASHDNNTIFEVTAPDVITPAAGLPKAPAEWIGERQLVLLDDRAIREFHAPLLLNSQLKGFVRIGYFKPTLHINYSQIPLLASLALPIFLLTPLFYGLLRREIKPLALANRQIANDIKDNRSGQVVRATGELADFMKNFNQYINHSKHTIDQLEKERSGLIASTSIDAYKSKKISAILHSVPDALIFFDSSGTIVFANQKVEGIFGSPFEVVTSAPLKQWCEHEEVFSYIAKIQQNVPYSLQPKRVQIEHNGTEINLLMTPLPVYSLNDANEIIGTTLLIQDKTQASIDEASRDDFVAHISHELKTPLNSLLTYSEALLGPDGEDKAFRIEGLNVIFDESERMRDLINNLLNITKLEAGNLNIERRRVKLSDFLTDAFDNVRKSARSGNLTFDIKLDRDVGDVAVDKGLLRIAINNLLTNAIKYNRDGGNVRLELEEIDDVIYIKVADTGIGISQEEKERIFEKFYRSDSDEARQRSGHGLGLALARDIVQLHNGQLSVTSEPGKGTEFVIKLIKDTQLLKKIG